MCQLAHGMVCCVVGSGTQQFDLPSERESWYVLRGGPCVFYLSEAASGLCHTPVITLFTVVGHYPLLLSDKINASQLFPLLTLWLLMHKSKLDARVQACLPSCIDKSSKAINNTVYQYSSVFTVLLDMLVKGIMQSLKPRNPGLF